MLSQKAYTNINLSLYSQTLIIYGADRELCNFVFHGYSVEHGRVTLAVVSTCVDGGSDQENSQYHLTEDMITF